LEGCKGQIGKLGQLLGNYEEEREAERMRQAGRNNTVRHDNTREEQEQEEEDDEDE